jgi:peptidoglycan/LPS O-acetylase OafA/YrhL
MNIVLPRGHRRFQNIDALRAIAAFLVLWTHASEVFVGLGGSGRWAYEAAHLFDFGRIGVVAFFAISGFVIPMSLPAENTGDALRQFAVGRLFRLYPAFWISVLPGAFTFYWMWGKPFSFTDVLLNLTMIPGALGAQPAEGLYWTLQLELVFYTVCAALYRMGWLHNWTKLVQVTFVLLIASILLRHSHWWLYVVHLSIMFFGACCRMYLEMGSVRNKDAQRLLAIYCGYWVVIVPLYGFAVVAFGGRTDHQAIVTAVVPYAAAILLFIGAIFLSGLKTSVGAWLGKISYSIYLLHPIVLYTMFWCLEHSGSPWLREAHVGLLVITCAGITTVLATVNYYVVEKPCIALGNRLKRKLASARTGAPVLTPNDVA